MLDTYAITELLHEREITAVLHAYCQGVDRKDWKLARSAYFDDASDSHGAFEGTPDDLITWLQNRHEHIRSSAHLLSNISIRFQDTGEHARVESYYLSLQIVDPVQGDPFAGEGQAPVFTRVLGRYIDTFQRREGIGWRILNRVCLNEWIHRSDTAGFIDQDPSWPTPSRDLRDALYAPLPGESSEL